MYARKQITTVFVFPVLFFPVNSEKQNGTIYIVLWSYYSDQHWNYRNLDMEIGYDAFVRRNCSFQNCYLTTNHTYFESVLDFDVFLLNSVHLNQGFPKEFPRHRSPNQLYVFFSVEPAAYTSIPESVNGFFNVTWTYLLKSDVVHPYFYFKNKLGEIIAPKVDVRWKDIKKMRAISPVKLRNIENKRIAALWVASNCSPKIRLNFARKLNRELSKYGHRVDIFGRCGNQSVCQKLPGERDGVLTSCYSKIESDYYFYLAFENTFTEDYVSAKVLHGLMHYSVPIVYGGANYTRFLPDGTYINAVELGVERLAREMVDIINNSVRYSDFFKWHNYYTVHDAGADDYRESVCAFCAYLNDEANRNKTQVYENITGWYNAPYPDLYPNTASYENITSKYDLEASESYIEKTSATILSSSEFDLFLGGD